MKSRICIVILLSSMMCDVFATKAEEVLSAPLFSTQLDLVLSRQNVTNMGLVNARLNYCNAALSLFIKETGNKIYEIDAQIVYLQKLLCPASAKTLSEIMALRAWNWVIEDKKLERDKYHEMLICAQNALRDFGNSPENHFLSFSTESTPTPSYYSSSSVSVSYSSASAQKTHIMRFFDIVMRRMGIIFATN